MILKRIVSFVLALLIPTTICTFAAADTEWKDIYRSFIESNEYRKYIRAVNPEYTEYAYDRDNGSDIIALYDLDQDGIPELLVRVMYLVFEQIDVFSCREGMIRKEGTMGGDNFFQFIYSFEKAGIPDRLYTFMGGASMNLDEYRIGRGGLVKAHLGETLIDNGDTVGIRISIDSFDYGDEAQLEKVENLLTQFFFEEEHQGTRLEFSGKQYLKEHPEKWDEFLNDW